MVGRGMGISASRFVEVVESKGKRVFLGDEMGGGALGDLGWFLSKPLFCYIKIKHRKCCPSSCSAHRRERKGQLGRWPGQGAHVGPACRDVRSRLGAVPAEKD